LTALSEDSLIWYRELVLSYPELAQAASGVATGSTIDEPGEEKALYPDDNHVGTKEEKNHGELVISSDERIRGLDMRIRY